MDITLLMINITVQNTVITVHVYITVVTKLILLIRVGMNV